MKNNNNPPANQEETREVRCTCKQLLARLSARGLEFKCKRCKTLVVMPWPELQIKGETA